MTKVIEMVRSTSMPSSAAILRSCSQARWARPSERLVDEVPEERQQHGRDHDDDDLLERDRRCRAPISVMTW